MAKKVPTGRARALNLSFDEELDETERRYRYDSALAAAEGYYTHKKTMESIAKELGISRSSVSRLLTYARESGIVEIRIAHPVGRTKSLQAEIWRRYQVRSVVVSVPFHSSLEDRHSRTAAVAARFLESIVVSDTVLAVAWGTMVNAMSYHLKRKSVTNCQVVQLNGIGQSTGVGIHYSHAMLDRYGEAFNANVQQLPLPLFFQHARTKRMMESEYATHRVRQLIENANVIVFSVGIVNDGVPSVPHLYGSALDDSDFVALVEDGAVGDIATTFLDAEGDYRGIRLNDRTSGPDLERFADAARKVCVVSGEHKIRATCATLKGGYASDLVIDEITAQQLLDFDE